MGINNVKSVRLALFLKYHGFEVDEASYTHPP